MLYGGRCECGTGLAAYLLAARAQLTAVAVVLYSLCPVIPILIGTTVLREKLSATQAIGLVVAAATAGLLAT